MSEIKQKDLNRALWASADEMRKTMSADTYKDYLLGLVFFKSLSDNILYEVVDLLQDRKPQNLEEAQKVFEDAFISEDADDLRQEINHKFGCFIEPKFTFTKFAKKVEEHRFMLADLAQAFRDIEQSQNHFYEGLFEDFDINSKDLGKTDAARNSVISSVIRALSEINFQDYDTDALGDAYEYLIAQFAAGSGTKAGEFYTPKMVSRLIGKIVTAGKENKSGFSVYDPTMGSGSLLLQARNFIQDTTEKSLTNKIQYFGQEIKNQTYNLARMNMILHKVSGSQQHLRQGDTLGEDWPSDEPTVFDAVVMNPPYSLKYNPTPGLLADPRFSPYEKLPPASKADLAFLLHGFYHLKEEGTMGIVLPHGVLFRGSSEGTIRRKLLEKGNINAVIGLPAGIFFSTGIPTCIVVLRKKDCSKRDVLFIDASKEFKKEGPRNYLLEEHIEKIFNAYKQRQTIEKYSYLASFEEIKKNDFNLNIPRYVDTSEEEEEIDLKEVFSEIKQIESEEVRIRGELNESFKALGLPLSL